MTYPFQNNNGTTIEVATVEVLGMDKQFHQALYWSCNYLSMLWWKLNQGSKRGPCSLRPFPNILIS